MKFSILSLLIPLTGLLAAGCSSSRVASSEYDDVYYSSRDVTSRTVVTTETTTYPEYRSEATGQPEGELNPEYSSASSGTTYITNNYQTEYYRRDYFGGYDPLYRPSAYRLSYWDVPYNNYYWYDPFAPTFSLSVYSSPFYHCNYGWYDSPFGYGYGYPVYAGVNISIGYGYYNYCRWSPYNYWGGYYNRGYYNDYYGGGGYYRGFYDGFYASGGRRNTYYGRRQERSVVPTSGISPSGDGRISPATRPNRDGRINAGGRQQQMIGNQPADQRSNVSPVREERGIKPGREVPTDVRTQPNAMPANQPRPATESKPVRQYDSAPVRNETGIKPDRQQINQQLNQERPVEQQRPVQDARPTPNEVKPSRQQPEVRPNNYQFRDEPAQPAKPTRNYDQPVRNTGSDYTPAKGTEQLMQQERPVNVQPEPYRPAPERPVNVRPDRPADVRPEQPVYRQEERPVYRQEERPVYRQEERPVYRQEERPVQQAPRPVQQPREERAPSFDQPSRPVAPAREAPSFQNSGSRMRGR